MATMKLVLTPSLRKFLSGRMLLLPSKFRSAAESALQGQHIEWALLKEAHHALVDAAGIEESIPSLLELCRGGSIAHPSPPAQRPPGAGLSPELQAHMERLRAKLDQDRYDAMVRDVTTAERAAQALSERGFATYKLQMSFGLHVVVMMGAFYAFGHVAGMSVSTNVAVHAAVGLAFMIFAMLLETVLFIIRTTVPPKLPAVVAVGRNGQRRQRHGEGGRGGGGGAEGERDAAAGVEREGEGKKDQ